MMTRDGLPLALPLESQAPYIHVNTLLIFDVRPSDFVNYTCFARSSVESAREVVSLQSKREEKETVEDAKT